jgi:DNA-binding response OmpR family regulator
MRLLLVEDDAMLGSALRAGMRQDGHAVDWVQRASDAHAAWLAPNKAAVPYEAVVLDLGLVDGSGIDLLRAARARGSTTPVVIITARDRIADRVAGLDAGADDYMVKPVDLDELSARLRAIERRRRGDAAATLTCGALKIEPAAHRVEFEGRPVALTGREFALLLAMVRRPGAVLTRAQLEEALYGWDEPLDSNAIEVHIHRLRRKLDRRLIETHRGIGYRLACGETAPTDQPA